MMLGNMFWSRQPTVTDCPAAGNKQNQQFFFYNLLECWVASANCKSAPHGGSADNAPGPEAKSKKMNPIGSQRGINLFVKGTS